MGTDSNRTPGTLRRIGGNVALGLGSVALTLLALEGVARVLRAREGGGKEAAEIHHYHEYDPLLGWRKTAGAKVLYKRREYTVEVAINSRGLRDPERSLAPAPGTFRVLALGDSFLEGYTVPLEQTVTQVLEANLGSRGCRAEVLNGGTAAYSTDQEYLFYQWHGVDYRPQIVALFFYYNDVLYNDRQDYFGGPKPAFEMRTEGLCLHRYPVRERPAPPPAPPAPDAQAQQGSALLAWLSDRLWYGAPRAYNALARIGLWEPMPQTSPRLEMFVYARRRIEEIEGAWAKTAGILGLLQAEVAAHDGRLVVVYVPSRMEVQDRSWELTKTLYRLEESEWDRGIPARRLAEIGRAQSFAVLDLTQALRSADRGRLGDPYFTYDGHWTKTGHAVAARELGAFLARQGWLPSCAQGPW